MNTMKILFDDHGICETNQKVAGIGIDELAKQAEPEFQIGRVIKTTEPFDRAVLHLEEQKVDILIKAARHPFVALLVTTEPGIPFSRAHRVMEDPGRLVLAVRRMSGFADPAAWRSFLVASVDDCRAVAEGRLGEVADNAKPMLGLFVARSLILPALRILCLAFQEINKRKTDDPFWREKAEEAAKPEWWHRVLDGAFIRKKDSFVKWGVVRRKDNGNASVLLMEGIKLEAQRQDSRAEAKIEKLVRAISTDNMGEADMLVRNASDGLEDISR